jgi:hypothetical protein
MKRWVAGMLFPAVGVLFVSSAPAADPPKVAGPGAMLQVQAAPPTGACPSDMVEVEGEYCPAVEHICVKWMENGMQRDRCAEYRATSKCYGTPVKKHFCIDRYEWPNQKGATPVVAVSFDEAAAQCKGAGKRLCKDSEWTLACEGADRLPYPYGYARDEKACNHDKFYIQPNNDAYADPRTRAAEIARVDQREASGSRQGCVSQFGVHDMVGNVDEWVVNEKGFASKEPYMSGLKGGYWGPVRNRCRPMTTDHNAWHHGYQIGFRCCADAGTVAQAPRPQPQPKVATK